MKRILSLFISILIMAVIFWRIDLDQFKNYFVQVDLGLFTFAVLFFIPQIAISAYRWSLMVQSRTHLSFWESSKMTLAAGAINILLPSRVGDLSKAYFIGRDGGMEVKRGMNVVFFEKYIDLASLGIVVLTGILWSGNWDYTSLAGVGFASLMIGIFPVLYFVNIERWVSLRFFEKSRFLSKAREFLLDTHEYLMEIKGNPELLGFIIAISIFLWFLHIFQFYVIFLAFHSDVSVFQVFRLVPLAILVGLVPLTIAGMGTRDSALIFLFSPYESAALVAGVGLFASLRYFVPGIFGLPFLNHYIVKKKQGQ